ncbi:MAG: nitrilase family protein [Paramuribaculum sp.]|nr:nitrilase family protein [Paramuribaculum sp.]
MYSNPAPNLKVAVIPLDVIPADVKSNLAHACEALSRVEAETDIAVLPELFNSGFTTDAELLESIAEEDDSCTMTEVKRWAKEFGFTICGSFAGKADGCFYNRGFIAKPDGTINFYNKRHLFRLGGEYKAYQCGTVESPIVDVKGWNIAMAICYDIRFPVWNRNAGLKYDVLIVPANWPHVREFAWRHLLIARAIENQAYVVGCNRSGKDEFGEYPVDDSYAFDYMGADIAQRNANNIIYCEFDKEKLLTGRSRFKAWLDADEFTINIESTDEESAVKQA